MALSSDGNTALAADSGFYSSAGTVYAFRDAGGTWSDAGALPGLSPANGGYGVALTLDSGGTRALVGDYGPTFLLGTASPSTPAAAAVERAPAHSPRPSRYDLYSDAVAVSGPRCIAAQ